MADARFFDNKGPFRLSDLAERSSASLAPGVDGDLLAHDVAPLDRAGANEISFLDNRKYIETFSKSAAGACIARAEHVEKAPVGMALLLSEQPYHAYALVAAAFYPETAPASAIAASAVIDETATIGDGCEIGPNVVIGPRAEIGRRCRLDANVVLGPGVIIGDDCRFHAGVSVTHSVLGARVTLHPGARVGQDGFGFAPNPDGHVKVPQVGRVVVGDDCDIGANTTIDRGSLQDTVIGAGCWIDNLVQIGHNVVLGYGCIVVAQVGISGSTKVGDFAAIGGQVGIAGHLKIGDGAQIAATSGVMNDVPPGARYGGAPAMPIKEFFRQVATLRRLSEK